MNSINRTKFLKIEGAAGFLVITSILWAFFTVTDRDNNVLQSIFPNQVVADTNDTTSNVNATFDLSDIRNKKTRFARKLAIFNLVDGADEKTLGQLFDQSTQMPSGSFRSEIERAIVRKWATVSPTNVLTHIEGIVMLRYRDLLPFVFYEWARYDLDEAVAYATRFGPATRQIVFDSIRDSLPDIDVSELTEIAQELNLDYYAIQEIYKDLAASEIKDPLEAWTQFFDEHQNRLSIHRRYRRDYILEIAKAIGDMGVDAIYEAIALVPNVNDRLIVIPPMVYQVLEHDPQGALEFALAEETDIISLTWEVVTLWADFDPNAALTAVSAIEDLNRRVDLQSSVLDHWSENDPISLLKEINNLPESSRQIAEEKAWLAVAKRSPEQATSWLQEIEDLKMQASVASQIVTSWAKRDATAALNWINSERFLEPIKDTLFRNIVRSVTLTNTQWALDTALEYSVPTDTVGPEAEILAVIARYDPDAALKILPVARNEATKIAGLLSIGSHLVGASHDSHDRAIKLADELSSDEDKNRYLSILIFDFEYEDLYSMIDQFPTSDLREQAANLILDNDKQNLSATQIEKLQAYQTKSE